MPIIQSYIITHSLHVKQAEVPCIPLMKTCLSPRRTIIIIKCKIKLIAKQEIENKKNPLSQTQHSLSKDVKHLTST